MSFRASILLLLLFLNSSGLCFYQDNYVIRDLEGTTQTEFRQETLAWEDNVGNSGVALDTACGSMYLLAYSGASYKRVYDNLPTHQSIALSLELYLIDAAPNDYPQIDLQGNTGGPFVYDVSPVTTNFCGSAAVDLFVTYFQAIPHTGSTLTLTLLLENNQQRIRNIKILIATNDISTASTKNSMSIADPSGPLGIIDYSGICSVDQYDNGSCQNCDDACESCINAGPNNCYFYKDGYYFDGSSSLECDNLCETCYGAGSSACLTCPWGDPADANNQCILVCDEACSTCSGTTFDTCSACNDGYYFDGTTSCLSCDNSCETCSGAGSNACLTCPWGDPANVNSECVVCDAACKTCYDTDSASCYTCNDGYYFDGVSSCLECDSSCKTCSGAGPNACETCPSGDSLNGNSQCITLTSSEYPATASTKRITDIKAKTQTVVGAGLIAKTLVNPGNSGPIRFSMLGKMIQYIKYLDIGYPNDLKYALSNWDGDFINFNSGNQDLTPNGFQDYESSYDPLPSMILMYDDEIDSSFLMNFWEELIPIFVLCTLLISMIIFEVIMAKNILGETAKKITHQLRICVQGLLIIYLYNDFADIFFFAILSYRTTKKATALTVANIIVSTLFIILTIGTLIAQTWFVKKYQTLKTKDQDEFEKLRSKIEGVQVLWKDFKDDSFVEMNALKFIVLHNIIFCLILAILYEHPLAQVILINILSFAIITYLLWFRPFDDKVELIQTIICEGILSAVNICLLILVSLDSDSGSRESVGTAILVLTMLFNFVPLSFLAVVAITFMKKAYRIIKAYLLKRKLHKLKKPAGVYAKKSQVSPSIIESPKDEATRNSKFIVISDMSQINSVALGKKDSIGTNLLSADVQSHGHNLLSPPSIQIDGTSEHDDRLLNNEESPSKLSKSSIIARLQQNITLSQKSKNENL